jgi:hypothetical protein
LPADPYGGFDGGMERPQKITLGEMRASGVRGLLVYCADYKSMRPLTFAWRAAWMIAK